MMLSRLVRTLASGSTKNGVLPIGPVPRHADARLRSKRAVDAKFGAGAQHIEREQARADAKAEFVARRVLERRAEKQERRAVALRQGAKHQAVFSALVSERPRHRFESIEAAQLVQPELDRREVDLRILKDGETACMRAVSAGPAPSTRTNAGTGNRVTVRS